VAAVQNLELSRTAFFIEFFAQSDSFGKLLLLPVLRLVPGSRVNYLFWRIPESRSGLPTEGNILTRLADGVCCMGLEAMDSASS
jgi:hypothetical protein